MDMAIPQACGTWGVSPPWKILWAKSDPRHPLWKHLLDAAAVSRVLPKPRILAVEGSGTVALWVGLHDIGKSDGSFQHQIPDFSQDLEREGYGRTGDARCRHERLSARFLRKKLAACGMTERWVDTIARAVLAHHGYWDESARDGSPAYAQAQEALFQMLQDVLKETLSPRVMPQDHSAFGMALAGHVVLCDWIASNEDFFTDPRLRSDEPEAYFPEAQEVAREWITKLSLESVPSEGPAVDIVATARPIQKVLLEEEIPPGLVIIEAPMGEGKTEAAWILAEQWRAKGYRGMYMALPTMATSDSLYRRYRDDYLAKCHSSEAVRLVHGMAWLRDDLEPENLPETGEPGDDRTMAAAWFRPTRRAMLAPHGVGTVDQAMLAGMNVKFGFLRLYGLADRVLVIDEVHAYDAYMSAIIGRLLQWCACMAIPVVLLSATLSAKQRAAMIEAYGASGGDPGPGAPYPLVTVAPTGSKVRTFAPEASSQRTLRIETHPGLCGDAKKTAQKAEELVRDGGCCCVILNTVKQAQAVYRALALPKEQKLLFHARFTAEDRQRITERVLELFGKDTGHRPEKFVLVATQVVEQSLDVDFDHMISEIAPMDLLLQRSGRLHRHRQRHGDPILHVLLPGFPEREPWDFGGTGYVYAPKPLLRTLALLENRREMLLPEAFRELIEACYGQGEWGQNAVAWEEIRKADAEWNDEAATLSDQGKQFALRAPGKRSFCPVANDPAGDDSDDGNGWRAQTRLGTREKTAVLVTASECSHLEGDDVPMAEVRALYRRSLKLPSYLPWGRPAEGYRAAMEGQKRLRGIFLVPLGEDGSWQGVDGKGTTFRVAYHEALGLLSGRLS